jgi:hypothetical protein
MLNNQIARMKQTIIGIPTASLAALLGVNPNRVSLFVNGTKQLSNVEIVKLDALFDDLTQLVDCAKPWPINWRDVQLIKELLRRMKLGEFDRAKENS